VKRTYAWTLVGALSAAVAGLWLFSFFPLFGALSYLFLPSAIVLLFAVAVGAIAVTVRPTMRVYLWAALGALGLLTLCGAYLRYDGDRLGSAGVHHEMTIERPIVASLREPVFLDSKNEIVYDRAMFDTVHPWCREGCVLYERLDWYRLPTFEQPKDILQDVGVKPVGAGEARIKVVITSSERGNRTDIAAQVMDDDVAVARLHAVVPSLDRRPDSPVPVWPRFALENNPIVLALMPARKYVDRHFLKSFLSSAIVLETAEVVPVFNIVAAEIVSEPLSPPLAVDRSDPTYLQWWFMSSDERCDGVISVEQRPGVADKYVTFASSTAQPPQLRLGSETLICAGDAVYVHRFGRVPRNVLDFSRYSLTGKYTADLRIRLPDHAVTTFIAFEPRSVSERDRKLSFTVRNVRFQWAQDEAGKPVRRPDGGALEHAIIDRRGEYEAPLPAESLALH
jgi:hypothetical protein